MVSRDDVLFSENSKKLLKTNKRCVRCGCCNDLEVHHITPILEGGNNELDNLMVLCHDCHMNSGLHNQAVKNGLKIAKLNNIILKKERLVSLDEWLFYATTMMSEDEYWYPDYDEILTFLEEHTRKTPKRMIDLLNKYPSVVDVWTNNTEFEGMSLEELNEYAKNY